MATLMEFAAMQLERETGNRSSFPEDTPTDTRPASIFWDLAAADSLVEHARRGGGARRG